MKNKVTGVFGNFMNLRIFGVTAVKTQTNMKLMFDTSFLHSMQSFLIFCQNSIFIYLISLASVSAERD